MRRRLMNIMSNNLKITYCSLSDRIDKEASAYFGDNRQVVYFDENELVTVYLVVNGATGNATFSYYLSGVGAVNIPYPIQLPIMPYQCGVGNSLVFSINDGEGRNAQSNSYDIATCALAPTANISNIRATNITSNSGSLLWDCPVGLSADTRVLIIGYPTYNYAHLNPPVDKQTLWTVASSVWGQGTPISKFSTISSQFVVDSYTNRRVVFDGLASIGQVDLTNLAQATRYRFAAWTYRCGYSDRNYGNAFVKNVAYARGTRFFPSYVLGNFVTPFA